MIDFKKHAFLGVIWTTILLFSSLSYLVFAWLEQWKLTFEIKGLGLRHGTPNNVNLWTYPTLPGDQEIIRQFDDIFWVEDLLWSSTGYYTTIQCDGVYGPSGNRLTGIYLKAGNTSPTLLQWRTGNVFIATGFSGYISILNPVTYIYKPTSPTNAALVNKYWDRPRLKIVVPANSPAGTYSGTIVFSLYMN